MATKANKSTTSKNTSQLTSYQAQISSLQAQAVEREKLLKYIASLLLKIQAHIELNPVLQSFPKKFNLIYYIKNWKVILTFVEYLVQILLEFRQNVKIEQDSAA